MFYWLRNINIFNSRTGESQLTRQFFVTLRANLQQCNRQEKKCSNIVEEIEEILYKQNKTWTDAYEIERLMVNLYDDIQIRVELTRRLVEAERSLFSNEYEYYQKQISDLDDKATGEDSKPILDRLINDLQWRYTLIQLKREFSQGIRANISLGFIVSTTLFFIIFFTTTNFNWFYGVISGAAGFWGASFSMIVSINNRLINSGLEDLRLLSKKSYFLSRVTIGIGSSLILYFILQVGMLSGSIFPDMATITTSAGLKPLYGSDLSLLIIWSFIAGFSEKFVPNLLSKTEEKVKLTS